MNDTVIKQQFLDYVCRTQIPKTKVAILNSYYDAIRREMQRQGAWREDAQLLDVGCGLGLYTEYFHSRGFRATGVDLDADLISHARTRTMTKDSSIRYEIGAADRLPFEDHSFDIVFANSLLEHVPDWTSCIDEWIRVLVPGGLLWIETTNVICPRQREFRWLPVYSWWPGFMKQFVVNLARGPFPALANYTQWPAIHWFSFFQIRQFLRARDLLVRDRFDCMDTSSVGITKRFVRSFALSGAMGRWFAYLLMPSIIIFATKTSSNFDRSG